MDTEHQQAEFIPTKEIPTNTSISQQSTADPLAASQNNDAQQANSSLDVHKEPLTNGTSHLPEPISSERPTQTEQPVVLPPTMSATTTAAAEPISIGELVPPISAEIDPAQHEESDLRHTTTSEPIAPVTTLKQLPAMDPSVSEAAVPLVNEAPASEPISAPADAPSSALVDAEPAQAPVAEKSIESGVAAEVNTTSDFIQSSVEDVPMQDVPAVDATPHHDLDDTKDAMHIDASAPSTSTQPPPLGIQTDLPSQPKHPRDDDESADGPVSKRAKADEESQPMLPPHPSSGGLVDTPTAMDTPILPPPRTSSRHSSRPASRGGGGSRPSSRGQSKAGTPVPGSATAQPLQKKANGLYPVPEPRPHNPEWDKPMTAAQKKHLLRGIQNARKGHHASSFAVPVDPGLLGIPTYPDIVKEPMDLRTLDTNLKEDHYATVNAYLYDVDLIMTNSVKFNGPEHTVTQQGILLHASFERNLASLPNASYVEPNASEKKAKKMAENPPKRRESRVLPSPSAGSARSPTNNQTFALKSDGVPLIRRDSTLQDGRPRREIHPPAPKDLPYSNTKPKRKKYVTELKFCAKVLEELKKAKYSGINYAFLEPVDPVALNIPNYLKVIKKPMDMRTMGQKLERGEYENAREFEDDFRLMLNNCFKFNPEDHPIHIQGKELLGYFEAEWKNKQRWVKEHTPRSTDISPESSEAEDEDEEEEDEDDNDEDEDDHKARELAGISAQIVRLQATLASLSDKKSSPPVDKKKKKKSVKPIKEKSKKSSKPLKKDKVKKPPTYPQITFQEKMTLSERINELPSENMDVVMEIIKRGMPHLDFDSPDIELDIEDLPSLLTNQLNHYVKTYNKSVAQNQNSNSSISVHQAAVANANNKPKKNRPMKAEEQNAKIAEIEKILAKRNAGGNGGAGSPTTASAAAAAQQITPDESSSGDDSEESEED